MITGKGRVGRAGKGWRGCMMRLLRVPTVFFPVVLPCSLLCALLSPPLWFSQALQQTLQTQSKELRRTGLRRTGPLTTHCAPAFLTRSAFSTSLPAYSATMVHPQWLQQTIFFGATLGHGRFQGWAMGIVTVLTLFTSNGIGGVPRAVLGCVNLPCLARAWVCEFSMLSWRFKSPWCSGWHSRLFSFFAGHGSARRNFGPCLS
jgi:hypothetical protein